MRPEAPVPAVDRPQVVSIGILTSGSSVLMTRHRKADPLEGLWEFPGGKVEFGEHPWETLQRELKEELAVTASGGSLFGIYSHVYDFGGTEVHYVLVAYRVRVPRSSVAPTPDRQWLTREALGARPVVPGSRPIVRDLVRTLT
jgi:8-oxo-dGTP diphosphatase